MKQVVNINPKILSWGIIRAGHTIEEIIEKNPAVKAWMDGTKQPTVKQLEDFSKKIYLPFGYFFYLNLLRKSYLFRFSEQTIHGRIILV